MRRVRIETVVMAVLACAAAVIRVLLAYKTPVSSHTFATIDDGLLINNAISIWHGEWLGPYGEYTLAKNPGYSMAMALFRIVGIRYQLGFALLLCFACAVAARSLRPLVPRSSICLALFVVLLYVPAFFTSSFFQRIYRNGMAMEVVLLLFSSYVGLYLRRKDALPKMLVWALISGVSLGFFSIVMESASWVMPFVLVCTLVMLVLTLRDALGERVLPSGGNRVPTHMGKAFDNNSAEVEANVEPQGKNALVVVARIVLLLCPLAIYVIFPLGVTSINNSHYGVALVNDKYQGEFARASADMMNIDVDYPDDRVWLSVDALNKALEVSSTLREMEPQIRKAWELWGSVSAGFNATVPGNEQQVLGDHPYWALRSAYEDYGGYSKSAPETERYWAKVANEIEAAFDSGKLHKKTGLSISSTTQPMPNQRVASWVLSSVQALGWYAWGDQLFPAIIQPLPDTFAMDGRLEDQMAARELLGNNTIFKLGDDLFEDKTTEVAQPWLKLDRFLGNNLIRVQRALLCLSIVGVFALLVLDIRSRNIDGVRSALILLGLFLSSFVLVFGASWMISFLSSGESAMSAAVSAFSYCGPIYMLVAYAECLVLGRVAQKILDRFAPIQR